MNLGSDEAITGVWSEGAEGALERGYNVVVFEGPGQQSMLFERDIPFRPDWEKVLTPVVDFLLARDDVDADRLCLYGVSQAGYWVPRALAFEHRFAAAIADGGVVDVLQSWLQNLPHLLRKAYENGEKEKFDKEMALAMRLPGRKAARTTLAFRSRPYGVSGELSDVLDVVAQYNVKDVAAQITTPLYVIDADGDHAPSVIGRAEALPFADAAFDAVLSTQTLGLLDEPERAGREICRVTRPGGVVWLTGPASVVRQK
jgi:hypothetical protein